MVLKPSGYDPAILLHPLHVEGRRLHGRLKGLSGAAKVGPVRVHEDLQLLQPLTGVE